MAVVSRTSGFILALALLVVPMAPLVAQDEENGATGQAPEGSGKMAAEEAPAKSSSMFDWLFGDDEAPEVEDATREETEPEPTGDAVVVPIPESPEATPEAQAAPVESTEDETEDEDETTADVADPAADEEDGNKEAVPDPQLIDKTATQRYSILDWIKSLGSDAPAPTEGQPETDAPEGVPPIESVEEPEAPAEPAEETDVARETPAAQELEGEAGETEPGETETTETEPTETAPSGPAVRPKYRVTTETLDGPTPDEAGSAGAGQTERLGDALQELRERNPVVARIEGEEIRWSEVIDSAADLPVKYQSQVEALFPALLDRVIDLRLLTIAARRDGLAANDEIRRRVAAFEDKLLRELYVKQRLTQLVTAESLQARYDRLVQRLGSEQRLRARHILVESEAEARAVIVKLDAGEDFADLARQHSIGPSAERGGDLGYFDPKRMVPEFSQAAAAMEIGNFSREPVKTPFGWHVIQLVDRRHSGVAPFSELQDSLREQLTQEAMDEILSELRQAAELEVFPELPEESMRRFSSVDEQPDQASGESDAPVAAPE